MPQLQTIVARLREPSTFAGLAALITLFGAPPDIATHALGSADQIVAGVAGLLAVLLPEKGTTK